MSKQTANSLFIVSSMPRLYQELLSGVVSYEALGNRIIKQIKAAHAFRQVERVRELARILINIPITEYRLIAQYYFVWCQCRESKLNDGILESIVNQSHTYKTKAFLSLAGFAELRGEFDLEQYFLNESLKTEPNPSDYIQIIRAMAIIKAMEGSHKPALKDLENLIPLIKYAEPLVYYDFLNSYAVELGEVGRIEEACNISRVVLATPFAFAYPEWRETGQDLALRGYKSRSSVPIIRKIPVTRRIPGNLSYLSEYERSEGPRPSPFDQPRGVTAIADWKEKKMVKEPNGDDDVNVDEMDDKDLLATLIQVAAREGIDEEKLRDVVKYAIKTLCTHRKK